MSPFSMTLEYQIKNNIALFLSILNLKDLSEIYLGRQTTILGGQFPPAPLVW